MSERKAGWYWVEVAEGWEAAHWTGAEWEIVGTDDSVSDDTMHKIGPRIPTPDEPWQCVPVEPDEAMIEAALDAYTPFGDMKLAIQAAVVHAPKSEDAE